MLLVTGESGNAASEVTAAEHSVVSQSQRAVAGVDLRVPPEPQDAHLGPAGGRLPTLRRTLGLARLECLRATQRPQSSTDPQERKNEHELEQTESARLCTNAAM